MYYSFLTHTNVHSVKDSSSNHLITEAYIYNTLYSAFFSSSYGAWYENVYLAG